MKAIMKTENQMVLIPSQIRHMTDKPQLTSLQQTLRSGLTASQLVNAWSGTDATLRVQYTLSDVAGKADIPTLTDVSKAYGNSISAQVIGNHLASVYRMAGVKASIEEAGETITTLLKSFGYLNLAELCIFFLELKSGTFGQIVYGKQINHQAVMVCLQDFMRQRSSVISIRERNERQAMIDAGYPTIESAAQAIVKGIEDMKILKEKAKSDFKAFRELFPGLPNTFHAETIWSAYKGNEIALRQCVADYTDTESAQARLFDFLCDYNINNKNKGNDT